MIKDNGEPEDVGDCPTFMGLIVKHRKNGNNYDEMGFAQRIDMDYKNKLDQVGDFIVKWHKSEEEFVKECEKLGLIIETITL